jgi:hypothetical protein
MNLTGVLAAHSTVPARPRRQTPNRLTGTTAKRSPSRATPESSAAFQDPGGSAKPLRELEVIDAQACECAHECRSALHRSIGAPYVATARQRIACKRCRHGWRHVRERPYQSAASACEGASVARDANVAGTRAPRCGCRASRSRPTSSSPPPTSGSSSATRPRLHRSLRRRHAAGDPPGARGHRRAARPRPAAVRDVVSFEPAPAVRSVGSGLSIS